MAEGILQVPQKPALNLSEDQISLIKNTGAKGATEDELRIFLYLAYVSFDEYNQNNPI